MGVSIGSSRSRGIGLALLPVPDATATPRRAWPRGSPALHRVLLQQVLRRRDLRRGDRAADPHRRRRTGCGSASTRASSTAPSTASARPSAGSATLLRRHADRLGARLRRVAASRRRADPRLLPVALAADAVSHSDARSSPCRSLGALVAAARSDDERNESLIRQRRRSSCRCSCSRETLLLWARFDPASADFQFVERHAWIPAFGISYAVGVDGISLLLIVLTGFLTPLALLSLVGVGAPARRARSACFVLLLESAMIGVFVSLDLFLFYVFWDAMLIPMYFLIGIWGYERRDLRRRQVHPLHDGRQRADAARDPRPRRTCTARATGRLQLRSAAALRAAGAGRRCSSGSSWRSRWRSRSRCRCFRSTPGCPTRTSRRRRPAR